MPQVQFRDGGNKVYPAATMVMPKKIQDLNAWYKSARKACPAIPELSRGVGSGLVCPQSGFLCYDVDVTEKFVKFRMKRPDGTHPCELVILRTTWPN